MKLQPHDLTFLAEQLGKRDPAPIRWLELLAGHQSPLVREGAVYGLALNIERKIVRLILDSMSVLDPCQEVRNAAMEALES